MRWQHWIPHVAVVLIIVLAVGDVFLIRSGYQQYRDEAELPFSERICGISRESLASGLIPANYLGGSDDRVRVDSAAYPWSAIGVVYTPESQCTGVLVGDSVVLSAGHCFPGLEEGRFDVSDIWFLAGVTRDDVQAESRVRSVLLSPTYNAALAGRPEADWAFLTLDDALGQEVGSIPVAAPAAARAVLETEPLTQAGYSVDQPFDLSAHRGCSAVTVGPRGWFTHDCDVLPGDSGSPIMAELDGRMTLVGLTTDIFCLGDRGADGGAAASVDAFDSAFRALSGF